jgi:predicted site-specific integrase-resolvase
MPPRHLLTVAQVAEMFEVTQYTVREWLRDTSVSLTGRKLPNGRWLIHKDEARRFAQERYGAENVNT